MKVDAKVLRIAALLFSVGGVIMGLVALLLLQTLPIVAYVLAGVAVLDLVAALLFLARSRSLARKDSAIHYKEI